MYGFVNQVKILAAPFQLNSHGNFRVSTERNVEMGLQSAHTDDNVWFTPLLRTVIWYHIQRSIGLDNFWVDS